MSTATNTVREVAIQHSDRRPTIVTIEWADGHMFTEQPDAIFEVLTNG